MKTCLVILVAVASALAVVGCGGSTSGSSSGGGAGGSGGGPTSSTGGSTCPPVFHFTGDLDGTKVDQAYCFRDQSIVGGFDAWLFKGDFLVDPAVNRARLELRFWGAGEYVNENSSKPVAGTIEVVGGSSAPRTFYCPGPGSSIKLANSQSAPSEINLTGLSKLGTCPGGGSPSSDSVTVVAHTVFGGGSSKHVMGTLGGVAIDSSISSLACEGNSCGITFHVGESYALIELKLHDTIVDGNVSTVADEVELAYPFDSSLTKDNVHYYCGSAASTVKLTSTSTSSDTSMTLTGLGALGSCPGTPVAGTLTGKE